MQSAGCERAESTAVRNASASRRLRWPVPPDPLTPKNSTNHPVFRLHPGSVASIFYVAKKVGARPGIPAFPLNYGSLFS